MPIPPLDKRGLLPPGIHDGAIGEIAMIFAITPYRQELFKDFLRFLEQEIKIPDAQLYMAGSFLSDKPLPNDIEITMLVDIPLMQSSYCPILLQLGMNHDNHKKQYRVDFYISWENGQNDFREFFQYVGEKTAQDKGLAAKDKRGIIKVKT